MVHSTSLTQHIHATPEKVWAVISDIPGSAATLSGIDAVQMLSDGPYGEGTRWKETRTMMGRAETVEVWVAQADPPRHNVVKALQGRADSQARFSLARGGAGTAAGPTRAPRSWLSTRTPTPRVTCSRRDGQPRGSVRCSASVRRPAPVERSLGRPAAERGTLGHAVRVRPARRRDPLHDGDPPGDPVRPIRRHPGRGPRDPRYPYALTRRDLLEANADCSASAHRPCASGSDRLSLRRCAA